MTRSDRWFRIVVTTAVLIIAGVGYFMIDSNTDADREREQAADARRDADLSAQSDENCEAIAHNNAAMRDLINTVGAPRTPPPDATTSQLEGYRVTNEERAVMRRVGANLFPLQLCADGVPPTTLVPPLEEP